MKIKVRSGLMPLALLSGMMGYGVSSIAAEAPVDAHKLGVTESMVSYCARVDAPDAEKLKAKVRQLVHGTSADALSKIRKSDEYRQGYEAVSSFVAKVDRHNAARPCIGALAAK